MNEIALLGKTIKDKRLSLNMRMDDVANKAGITRATLWSIEKGAGNCSISTLLRILDILDLSFSIKNDDNNTFRSRATRINTRLDKKINRFVIICVEQYANSINESSDIVYNKMLAKGIINDLTDDYEDLHGMSHVYLNDYIDSLLNEVKA